MSEVSKFIPMENSGETEKENAGMVESNANGAENSAFKVCVNNKNLPAKPSSMWNKLKGIFCYEIEVELTPYQQKIEDEINEFLHQEITWEGFKKFLFQDVNITFGKKK